MIDAADEIVGAVAFTGTGYWLGVKHSVKRLPPWSSMRLVKRTGTPPDDYIETRDTGRSSRLARLWFGRDFRYVVRRYIDAEVVDDVRTRHVEHALEIHEKLAKP